MFLLQLSAQTTTTDHFQDLKQVGPLQTLVWLVACYSLVLLAQVTAATVL